MVDRRSKIAVRVLLLVLLFSVQALCHAHAIEHQADLGHDSCVVCSFSGTLDHIAMADAFAADCPSRTPPHPWTQSQVQARDSVAQPGARAPPSGY